MITLGWTWWTSGAPTGQRKLAATVVIATGNFGDRTNVLVLLAAARLVGMVLVMPLAAEFGKRAHVSASVEGADASAQARRIQPACGTPATS
ncbi:MAG TPA: hypothetical protein VGP82_25545 [Ktedonobacterales bacterium]|nr:hypothetical protein [Ktedonobacterales bacterium]